VKALQLKLVYAQLFVLLLLLVITAWLSLLLLVGYTSQSKKPSVARMSLTAATDDVPWGWSLEESNLLYSVEHYMRDYDVKIVRVKDVGMSEYSVVISDKEFVLYSWRTHPGGVFARTGSVMYITDYSPVAPGCSLRAYDITAKRELWTVKLKAMGEVVNSKYMNDVCIEVKNDCILVKGKESVGSYLEMIDPATGDIVYHKGIRIE
jgi:hypothetical protein